jgi:hypothetical protein
VPNLAFGSSTLYFVSRYSRRHQRTAASSSSDRYLAN